VDKIVENLFILVPEISASTWTGNEQCWRATRQN